MQIQDIIKRYFETETGKKLLSENLAELNEIRVRADKPVILRYGRGEKVMDISLSRMDIGRMVSKMAEYSLFAFQEEIRNGYITLKGGFRVGICGRAVVEKGILRTIRDCTSLNIRVPRNIKGCAEEIVRLYDGGFENTVLISPPGCGKTTMLRDTIRSLSGKGYAVGVCDERGELNCFDDLGIRTDVIEGCSKARGIDILVRGLSPDIIAVDELGGAEDREAVRRASHMGVGIIATLHGDKTDSGLEDMFRYSVLLESEKGGGKIKKIYD